MGEGVPICYLKSVPLIIMRLCSIINYIKYFKIKYFSNEEFIGLGLYWNGLKMGEVVPIIESIGIFLDRNYFNGLKMGIVVPIMGLIGILLNRTYIGMCLKWVQLCLYATLSIIKSSDVQNYFLVF